MGQVIYYYTSAFAFIIKGGVNWAISTGFQGLKCLVGMNGLMLSSLIAKSVIQS